ncbi:VanZ family protein [Aquibacillus koreensis]|uniref:VanZ family protein n=1 Tax=Aquibacillus koreensis TaxID=279446 RepID=A0A9X3WH59_9BACI|nr:VanZ family protein [Aquibacillus koreensis]MCT2534730.1 VanZ family protein [Aquibacillus koreensis]MDC3419660.1 VanZ family protein [Aquibacillus koreensis]
MYSIYDVVVLGSLLLILYIIVDFIRNKTRNLIRRIILYSFVFYFLNVVQLTTGGIVIPPQKDFVPTTQLIPFYFIGDLFSMYRSNGLDWFFWNSLKLTFFNFIMLMPLGIYLSLLFRVKRVSKALLIIFLVSLSIETIQFSFAYLGLVMGRGFNIDDLIVNTLGGVIGFLIFELIKRVAFCIFPSHKIMKDSSY